MDWQRFRSVRNGLFRVTRTGLPYLLVGLVSTVVLAWGLALAGPNPGSKDTTLRDRRRFDGEGLGRLVLHRAARIGLVRFDAVVYPTCVAAATTDSRTPEEAVPGWASAAVLPWSAGRRPWPQSEGSDDSAASSEFTRVEGAGWPLPAVWRSCAAEPRTSTSKPLPASTAGFGALATTSGRVGSISLPYRPIWLGLAADSALFAGVWWWLMNAPGMGVAVIRAVRGRCSACGYDLAGLPPVEPGTVKCPECGHDGREPRPIRTRPTLLPAA
jgi:hypothetical protein